MQKVKATVSLIVIFAALAFLAFRSIGFPPKIDSRPHIGIGQVLAEQAALLAGPGGRIVLIAPDVAIFHYPGAEVQLEALREGLRRANLKLAATNWVKLDPLRASGVPPGDFFALLKKYGEADVVVSLLGPPNLTAEQKSKVPPKHARVIAICAGDLPKQINLQPLFEDNLLHAAIVSRPLLSVTHPNTDDSKKWFDHLYQLVTSKNLQDLPPVANRSVLP